MSVKKYKYIYDRNSGHFIKKLNEDDNNVTTDTNQDSSTNNNTSTNSDTSTSQTTYKSVETDETIQGLNTKIQQLDQKFQQDLATQQKLLIAAKNNAANNKTTTGIYDPIETNSNVINIMKKINDMEKQNAIQKATLVDQKIQQLQKLASTNESYYKIPEKYKGLNESNLHTAKIYMKDLIVPDEDHILKGMVDFKRAFKDTSLLYGKDRDGYFVVAVDADDFTQLTDTLEETGYLRDEIIDTIMPQVLNRQNMIQ